MSKKNPEKPPLVNIVMATFNPRMDWLAEQLQSLNVQTYNNIIITICDDCSDKISLKELQECVKQHVTEFPCKIKQNAENLGSNKTFEELTAEAEGEYIAYCDQDDIWFPEKIEKLVDLIQEAGTRLVCSDVYVIDEDGRINANSITEVRKRHIFMEGKNLANDLLYRNFVIGCTMLMPTVMAKEALPFIEGMVHDHYLALYAATKGSIRVHGEKLIKYRIHGSNQTNVLANVNSKQDYYIMRIRPYLRRMEQINTRFPDITKAKEAYKWAVSRAGYYEGNLSHGIMPMIFNKSDIFTSIFELIMLRMPESLFKKVLKRVQRGTLKR